LLAAFRIVNNRKINIFFTRTQKLCIHLGTKAYVDDIAITLAQKIKNQVKFIN